MLVAVVEKFDKSQSCISCSVIVVCDLPIYRYSQSQPAHTAWVYEFQEYVFVVCVKLSISGHSWKNCVVIVHVSVSRTFKSQSKAKTVK